MLHRIKSDPLAALGLVLVPFVLMIVVTDIEAYLPEKVFLLPAFLLGPVAILGILSLLPRLSPDGDNRTAKAGVVMLVIAFSFLTLMLVVQQIGVRRVFLDAAALDQVQPEVATLVARTVSGVQLGMDFTFDIFFGIGLWMVAVVMYRHPDFGKFIGAWGVLTALYLLVSNGWAFPNTPHEAGVADPAAFALVWWAAVIAKDILRKRVPPSSKQHA